MSDPSEKPQDPVDAAFAEFHEAWFADKPLEPDAFCQSHPECGPRLREKVETFLLVTEGIAGVGKTGNERLSFKASEICGSTLGDFRIIKEIGQGGMATVYEAEQTSLNRKVALKILPSHLTWSDQSVRKFYREAEAGGRQSHPGIVAIYAVGEHEGRHFIVQELVEGGYTLADKLNDLRKDVDLPLGYFREAAKLIAKVADALQHAHASQVIHRDVKPSNILLTEDNEPKVTDFGLAKVEDALSLSRSGDLAGTPYYMSPEQAMSQRVEINHRTDIYSLGVTLYEMLTLKRPFEGKTSHEVLKKIVSIEPRDPRKVNRRVPQDLAMICLKAMEKDPNRRYQRMEELSEDLKRFLQGEVILAKPIGFPSRLWKRVKRNPVVSVTSAAALLALVILVLYVLWSYPQILKERNRAIEASYEAEQQREVALAAKTEVEKEIENVKAINEFLKSIFSSPKPEENGKEIKVVEVLDRADERIIEAFSDQPENEASLRKTIGSTYLSLGLHESALFHFDTAHQICLDLMGEEHPETLDSMHDVASAFFAQGRYSEAEALHRQVLEARRRVLGEEHPSTLESMRSLAVVFSGQARHSEAEALHRQALESQQRILGEEHPDTLLNMQYLAKCLLRKGEHSEAEALYHQVLEAQRRVLGEEHPHTLACMNDLAWCFYKNGKYSEAEERYQQALEAQRRVLGEEHPYTLKGMLCLAAVFVKQDKRSEAEALFRQALDVQRRTLGEEHPATLNSMRNFGLMLRARGRTRAEAVELFKQVVEASSRVLGEEHPLTTMAMSNLGRTYRTQAKLSKAMENNLRLFEIYRRVEGEEGWYTIGTLAARATLFRQLGKLEEAEKQIYKVIEPRKRILGEEHPDTLRSMSEQGLILTALGKLDEAESIHRIVLELRLKILGEDHFETLETMNSLADVLKKQNRSSEALQLMEKCIEIAGQNLTSVEKNEFRNRLELGKALTGLERYEEAEVQLQAAFELLQIGSNVIYPEVLLSLVDLYEAWGKPEKAAEYRALFNPKAELPVKDD
jgi:serine/threonine protein kinase/Tfp pilus assembly protein PilF